MQSRWIIKNAEGWLSSYAPGSLSWGIWAHAKMLDRAELVEAILAITGTGLENVITIERAG